MIIWLILIIHLVGRITCLLRAWHYTNKGSSESPSPFLSLDLARPQPYSMVRIYIAPNADDLPSWIATMQHIAKEGRCFVISVNQFCKVCNLFIPPFWPP